MEETPVEKAIKLYRELISRELQLENLTYNRVFTKGEIIQALDVIDFQLDQEMKRQKEEQNGGTRTDKSM